MAQETKTPKPEGYQLSTTSPDEGATSLVAVIILFVALFASVVIVVLAIAQARPPMVQDASAADTTTVRDTAMAGGAATLDEYGAVDAEPGAYRIPIDRAIDLMSADSSRLRLEQP